MAERRMFSKTVIDSDAFIEMPLSAQALYFHLAMRADDDGFVNNPNRIRNDIGASADDFKLLVAKRFLLSFDSGVIVIKHWKIHNYIRQDRYKPTSYIKERSTLVLSENGAYTEKVLEIPLSELGIPMVDQRLPQVSLELVQSKDRGSEGKDSDNTTTTTTISSMARERACEREKGPMAAEVAKYMRDELCIEDAGAEAVKFVAWNALRDWDCLPNWRAAADLWCARISERGGE